MESKTFIYGYAGLQALLNASKPTIWRILRSGQIDRAVSQVGRKIVVDRDLCLQLLAKK